MTWIVIRNEHTFSLSCNIAECFNWISISPITITFFYSIYKMNPPHRHIERVFNKYGSFPQKDDIILNDQRYGSTSGSKSGVICHFPIPAIGENMVD